MELVKIENNQPVTSSLQVAEVFNKRHSDVIRTIESKLISTQNCVQYKNMFLEDGYEDKSGKRNKMFLMNKDGWTFIAMGFTGKKADEFKLKYINAFNQMENHIKSNKQLSQPNDLDIKRINAEARLKNANSRQAKLLSELAMNTTNEVNKVLLEDKAVEVLTGKKLLEVPKLKGHLFDCKQIARKIGIISKSGKPHDTAVSQLIKRHINVNEDEFEIVPETVDGWVGSVTKYSQSVIDKVEDWLENNDYPSIIKSDKKNYHVQYKLNEIA